MPKLTRYYLKSAFIYLVVALLLGIVLALPKAIALPPIVRAMTPAYFHLFLLGWVTQMIFGIIYWMFPIITRKNPRGNEKVGWASYLLLNIGLLLRVFVEPLLAIQPQSNLGWMLAVSALLQWVAALLFVLLAWPRVKEKYRGG